MAFADEKAISQFRGAGLCARTRRFSLESDGRVVGFAALKMDGEHDDEQLRVFFELTYVFIAPEHRGKGLSRVLLSLVANSCRRTTSRMVKQRAGERSVILQSASQAESAGGVVFLSRLDAEMRQLAHELEAEWRGGAGVYD
ncbi:MAG TPA: GNAT family N-acetyltransferase [Arenimonas sp.]|uniref:GNAT family N-acetyltransferase n=1 Tax=Arenimonas sp. TaxID=1872635 RepID=UPI002D7F91E8|nr:GNAT family N-acetyltransferase [Arenimonas sp.]HEU0153307.1 GNAT family N-acetyltransferase [Arenimonas sp.]